MTKAICAIIPARQGSKGLPNKNTKLLGGHPLFAYSIAVAKMTPEIQRVIASTDSKEYAEIAIRYGAEAPFLRPPELSQDSSPDIDFVKHCINWFKSVERWEPSHIVHLRPTTPLRDPQKVSEAIDLLLKNEEASSLRSAHKSAESPLKWFKKDLRGYFTTIANETDIELLNRPRQEFPDVYIPNGYVDILLSNYISQNNRMHGNRVLSFETEPCVEIDRIDEFDYLEYLIQRQGSPIKDYLDSKKS